MSEDPKPDAKALFAEIDQRLNGVFGELGRALGAALHKLDEGGEVTRSETIATSKGPVRAEAGIRVRMGGLGGASRSATTGDPQPVNRPAPSATAAPPDAAPPPERRDIAATIVRDAGHWSLSAELPGMTEEDVTLTVADGLLEIVAEAGPRAYGGRFEIPTGLTRETMTVAIRNGILDVTAPLAPDTAGGEP